MKRYGITVNGKVFDVEVEEITGSPEASDAGRAERKAEDIRSESSDQKKDTENAEKTSGINTGGYPADRNAESGASIHRSRTPKTPKKKESAVDPVQSAAAGEDSLCSPMPGTVLKICVNPGDEVYAGETLIILEAMKMENEINSHKTGRIGTISVKTGDAVNTGDLLLTVE